MAELPWLWRQLPSSHLVEACGAVLFDLRDAHAPRVAVLLDHRSGGEVHFPKGRRNVGEPRHVAALRELLEETGYAGRLRPVTLHSRATRPDDPPDAPDEVRRHERAANEPFMVRVRKTTEIHQVGGGGGSVGAGEGETRMVQEGEGGGEGKQVVVVEGLKIIWYYIAEVVAERVDEGEADRFETLWLGLEEARKRLTFKDDREVLAQAVGVLRQDWECECACCRGLGRGW